MSDRINSNRPFPSLEADAKEIASSNSSSKSSQVQEGKTPEGFSVKAVDDSKEHAAMEKAASRVPTPDHQDAQHDVKQVSSSGSAHLGIRRGLDSIDATLEGLRLQLENASTVGLPTSDELHNTLGEFRTVSASLQQRYAAVSGSIDDQDIMDENNERFQKLNNEFGNVTNLLNRLQILERAGDPSSQGIREIHQEVQRSFLNIMEFSNDSLSSIRSIDSQNNTPLSSDRDSGSEKGNSRAETPEDHRSNTARPQTRAGRMSNMSMGNPDDMKWDADPETTSSSSSARPSARGSQRTRSTGPIDSNADAKSVSRSSQQTQKKEASDEEGPETNDDV